MPLEDLKKTDIVGGFFTGHIKDNGGPFILIDHVDSRISFKLQDGPVEEKGVNGCQIDQLVQVAMQLMIGRDPELTDEFNMSAIGSLKECMAHLENRRVAGERKTP